jgi:copper chaperone CopZ
MKRMMLIVSVAALFAACSCRQADWRVITIRVEDMKNQACADRAIGAIQKLPGIDVKAMQYDIAGRKLTVRYDSMQVAIKNLEFAVAEAGFTAIAETPFPNKGVPVKPEAAARLPPECK